MIMWATNIVNDQQGLKYLEIELLFFVLIFISLFCHFSKLSFEEKHKHSQNSKKI
jgi:hypothetical protein